jgi:hypothetical protein
MVKIIRKKLVIFPSHENRFPFVWFPFYSLMNKNFIKNQPKREGERVL